MASVETTTVPGGIPENKTTIFLISLFSRLLILIFADKVLSILYKLRFFGSLQ